MKSDQKVKMIALLAMMSLNACYAPAPGAATPTPTASVAPSASATTTPSISPTPANGSAWWKTDTGVDLRKCDSQVEEQQTPWCTAFGITSILANLVCDHTRLSIHHAWDFYEEYSVDAAANSVPGHNITIWDKWTEAANSPQKDYLDFAKHQLTGMKYIDTDDDIAYAMKVMDSGRPVYLGLSVPADLASCYSIVRTTTKITRGGHAVEIAGYKLDSKVQGGGYFIIKNSWSTECGDNGYQYMPFYLCTRSDMYCYLYEPTGVK